MFTQLPDYENYLINESGSIIDKRNNGLVRVSVNNQGLMYVHLDENIEYIHELVAKTYLTNRNNLKYVIHRDRDPLNNHISNLMWSINNENIKQVSRENRTYSRSKNPYEVYNEETGDSVMCIGRGEVAELIQYEEISLKNMIGNGRKITLGPYKGYQIRRIIIK